MEVANPPSFEEVRRELAQPILRYLERYVGDRAVAEDLQQETLLRMARGLASFAGRSSAKTWAFAIATRVATDHFRRPERRASIVDLDEIAETPDPGPHIAERVVVDEMSRCIRQVIDSLPETYRAALVLHDLEELTAAETAEVCGASVDAVKIRLHRARQRLKAALKKECAFYRDTEGVFRCDRKLG